MWAGLARKCASAIGGAAMGGFVGAAIWIALAVMGSAYAVGVFAAVGAVMGWRVPLERRQKRILDVEKWVK